MILLYEQTEQAFQNNGIGSLSDAVSCIVTEERNGPFELVMEYPITGRHYADIIFRRIILTKPNPYDQMQPFRIYRITKPIAGIVTVYAWHISYDLNGIPVRPFHTYTLQGVLTALSTNAAINNIFTYSTDKDLSMQGEINMQAPYSVRNILGGMQGSVLQTFRGEYKFDRFDVQLLTHRGSDNGVTLRYGKNIVNLEQDADYSNLYTGVAPYWTGADGGTVSLPETIVFVEGSFDFERILSLDLTQKFQEEPTADQLRAAASAYILENGVGVPSDSITISYAMDATIDAVHLCDTISAICIPIGVSLTAKCVKTSYDAMLGRYKEITLGSIRSNLADDYAAQTQNLVNRIQTIEANYATDGEVRTIAQEEIRNDTSIIQQAESIIATALEEYVRTTDYDTFKTSIMTQFSILAGQIEAGFTSTADSISTLSGSTEEQFASIYSFIRLLATVTNEQGQIIQEGGIVLGESSSDIKLKLENDVLYFFTGNESIITNPIAYFSAGKLYVNETQINTLTVGTDENNMQFAIVGSGSLRCLFLTPKTI